MKRIVILFCSFLLVTFSSHAKVTNVEFRDLTVFPNVTSGGIIVSPILAQAQNGTIASKEAVDKSSDLVRINVQSKNNTILYTSPNYSINDRIFAVFSYDASKLYFTSDETDSQLQLNVLTIATGQVRTLGKISSLKPEFSYRRYQLIPTYDGKSLIIVGFYPSVIESIELFSIAQGKVIAEVSKSSLELARAVTANVLEDDTLILHRSAWSKRLEFWTYKVSAAEFTPFSYANLEYSGAEYFASYNIFSGTNFTGRVLSGSYEYLTGSYKPTSLFLALGMGKLDETEIGSDVEIPFKNDQPESAHESTKWKMINDKQAIGWVLGLQGKIKIITLRLVDFEAKSATSLYSFEPQYEITGGPQVSISENGKSGWFLEYDKINKTKKRVIFVVQ